ALGDFAGSVEAVRKAEQLTQRDDPRWLSLPARILVEAYFLWDGWDDALDSYERFLDVFRRTAAARRQAMIGGVASGAVAGVHILRGEQERAERMEQRRGPEAHQGCGLTFGHALLGIGEPALALDRVRGLKGNRCAPSGVEAGDD